ncbi:ribosome biogenesis protein BRX1 homolog [Mobula birostris]|uniref:ribosome biogenesis protein BRX1 homolog n=1 Tax=Mobula birostris TaxID=1983395 RepID=UPI003B283CEA
MVMAVEVPGPVSRGRWTNKERVLIFSSRGISYRTRHLMQDLRTLMPHAKPDTKMDRKDKLFVINEICEMKNCNKCVYFEAKKKQDLYMCYSTPPDPASSLLYLTSFNLVTFYSTTTKTLPAAHLCLLAKASSYHSYTGPLTQWLLHLDPALLVFAPANESRINLSATNVCFSPSLQTFDQEPHYQLLKELFIQTFSTPCYHPRSQPFVDHVFTFTVTDGRIWFRNYQIIEEDGSLVEIGPRFVLNLIKIFRGSFGGQTLYENPKYRSPNVHRRMLRAAAASRFAERQNMKGLQRLRRQEQLVTLPEDPTHAVFDTPAPQKLPQVQQAPLQTTHSARPQKKLYKRQRLRLQEQ